MKVSIVSPESNLLSTTAKMVVARTLEGEIAFQPGHIPFVGVLAPGEVKVIGEDDSTQTTKVESGFIEVSHDEISILADVAELSD